MGKNGIAIVYCLCVWLLPSGLSGQDKFIKLLDLSENSWQYTTNAGGKTTIEVVPTAESPAGFEINSNVMFKLTSMNIPWEQWWWCGSIVLKQPVRISQECCNLKIRVYCPVSKFGIILKSNASTPLLEAASVSVKPNSWNTFEFNLSGYIGEELERIELVPHQSGQTFYLYPYFEEPTPSDTVLVNKQVEFGQMDEDLFIFGTNFYDKDFCVRNNVNMINASEITPIIPVETEKLFHIKSRDKGWRSNDCYMIVLRHPQSITTPRTLIAWVYSPSDKVDIQVESDNGTSLCSSLSFGGQRIIPKQWNKIALNIQADPSGKALLEKIKVFPVCPNTDMYVYFSWLDHQTSTPSLFANVDEISFSSLLQEMTNRESLVNYPFPYYTVRQFSSYDRFSDNATKGSFDWFANWDFSQFLRTEERYGRREFVMFDANGPGAVVRIWATVANYSDNGILRIYLDGSKTPTIEGEVLSLISGHLLTGPPISTSVSPLTTYKQRGHNLYLPIPYAKHCKITYESPGIIAAGNRPPGENFFYSVAYRTYDEGSLIKTFTIADLKEKSEIISTAQKELLTSPILEKKSRKTISENKVLTDRTKDNKIILEGEGAVCGIQVKLSATDLAQALRSVVLKISFDNNLTVWSPVGDFYGTGNRLSPYKSFYTTVSRDSVMSCYWVMPYKTKCEVSLENLRGESVKTSLIVYSSDWKWNDRTMYFGAGWTEYHRKYTGLHKSINGTSDAQDINFVNLSGQGIYVGDAVTIFNTVGDWWGEGDEKVYIDGENFPSHFGTGTEDYYGYAWCIPNFFDHPFIAQPDGTGAYQPGHVANLRYRGLDGITFKESLIFDMEFWHQSATYINYAPVTYWYMLPEGKSNRKPEEKLARMSVAKYKNDLVDNHIDKNGKVEGEFMNISLTGGIERTQCIPEMKWSNGVQFVWREGKKGDCANLGFIVDKEGKYSVQGHFTVAPDYGCFSISMNKSLVIPCVDTYSSNLDMKMIDLGMVDLKKGENILEIKLLGKNKLAINLVVGLDYLIVQSRD